MEPENLTTDQELIFIKSSMKRILEHHVDFKNTFKDVTQKIDGLIDIIHKEKTDRLEKMGEIKNELHGRINTMIFSFLGGSLVFIGGIVTWVITRTSP